MSQPGDPSAEKRAQQAGLYGEPVADLTTRIGRVVGIGPEDVARTIGISRPMFDQVVAGQRTKIGNPLATYRLKTLRDFTLALERGEASASDIDLTLSQIRASSLTSDPAASIDTGSGLGSGVGSGLGSGVGSAGGSGAFSGTPAAHPPIEAPVGVPVTQPPGASSALPKARDIDLLDAGSLAEARAIVGQHVRATPTRRWPLLEDVTRTITYVKHENNNPTGSFKVRGGLVYLTRLRQREPGLKGIVSATRGNHGQSLAYAGNALGIPVTIVVPEGNSPDKNRAMEALGADLLVHGRDFQEASEYAAWIASSRERHRVPSFHADLVTGVATYAAELHESVPDLDVVYVPVGMGSGICANIAVRDLIGSGAEVVGVVSELAPAYAMSFDAKAPIRTGTADTFVDGVATRTPDRLAVSVMVGGAARIVQVSERQAAEAMRLMYRTTHNLPEPAGSLALAGLLADLDRVRGKKVAVIHTGANCDFSVLRQVMADGEPADPEAPADAEAPDQGTDRPEDDQQ